MKKNIILASLLTCALFTACKDSREIEVDKTKQQQSEMSAVKSSEIKTNVPLANPASAAKQPAPAVNNNVKAAPAPKPAQQTAAQQAPVPAKEAPKSTYGKNVQAARDAKALIEDRNPDSIRVE